MYEKVRIQFDTICKVPRRHSSAMARRMLEMVRLMQGHARQSIRSNPPKIDGLEVLELVDVIADFLKNLDSNSSNICLHPDLRKPLESAQAVGRALHRGRGQPNWPAVRTRALSKIRAALAFAEQITQQQTAKDISDSNKSWRAWAKAAGLKGAGRAHRWTRMPTWGSSQRDD